MPRVSVINAAYNVAPYLAETIESILPQTYSDFKYIVVDDQSSDFGQGTGRGPSRAIRMNGAFSSSSAILGWYEAMSVPVQGTGRRTMEARRTCA